jgi:hypothetical protein
MSAANQDYRGYSADVRMQLSVNGYVFVIGHLGPDFIILDNPVDHPPAEGEITMSIDGRERRWHVHLPAGIKAEQGETVISASLGGNGSTVG